MRDRKVTWMSAIMFFHSDENEQHLTIYEIRTIGISETSYRITPARWEMKLYLSTRRESVQEHLTMLSLLNLQLKIKYGVCKNISRVLFCVCLQVKLMLVWRFRATLGAINVRLQIYFSMESVLHPAARYQLRHENTSSWYEFCRIWIFHLRTGKFGSRIEVFNLQVQNGCHSIKQVTW